MKTIHREITIGRGDIELEYELLLDGRLIKQGRADSLVDPFLKVLFRQMSRQEDVFGAVSDNAAVVAVTAATATNPAVITHAGSLGTAVGQLHAFIFAGAAGGSWAALNNTPSNPYWICERISSNTWSVLGLNAVGFGAYTPSSATMEDTSRIALSQNNFDLRGGVGIVGLGNCVGTNNQAVNIFDRKLIARITQGTGAGQLQYAANIINAPGVDAVSAQITVTRDFTNGSAGTITIKEFGLASLSNGTRGSTANTTGHLFARDIIADPGLPLLVGRTLTMNYRIKTQLTVTGGFLRQFADLLYRQAAQVSFDAKTIFNASNVQNFSANAFRAVDFGGERNDYLTIDPLRGEAGVVVGTGNTPVSMTDTGMIAQAVHGFATGKLVHYGSLVDQYALAAAASPSNASFAVSRLFENKSGATITVREIGIHALGLNAYHCIMRDVLVTPVALLNNEVLKVVYTVKIQTGV